MKINCFITVIFWFGLLLNPAENLRSDEYIIKSQKEYFTIEKHSVLQNNTNEWKTISYKKTHYIVSVVEPFFKQSISTDDDNTKSQEYHNSNLEPYCYISSNTDLIVHFNSFDAKKIFIFDIIGNNIYSEVIKNKSNYASIKINNYNSGAYFIALASDDNKKVILKFIKN
ncbi:MAG: T9SS type A sorting domain-containing protein [Candidatus Kapabacteria bacterium]|nr:T9SS type A sorting domain-containing protein [Candidatus Kapabacteria bacterium]